MRHARTWICAENDRCRDFYAFHILYSYLDMKRVKISTTIVFGEESVMDSVISVCVLTLESWLNVQALRSGP